MREKLVVGLFLGQPCRHKVMLQNTYPSVVGLLGIFSLSLVYVRELHLFEFFLVGIDCHASVSWQKSQAAFWRDTIPNQLKVAARRCRLLSHIFQFIGNVNPVSYTHLRAHETRHDLVCRLLL